MCNRVTGKNNKQSGDLDSESEKIARRKVRVKNPKRDIYY